MWQQLWRDETGAVVTLEVVMVGTIMGIGVITGLACLRDAVLTELADIAASVGCMDQSMTVLGSTAHSSATASMSFTDTPDVSDIPGAQVNERCLVICDGVPAVQPAGSEGMGGV